MANMFRYKFWGLLIINLIFFSEARSQNFIRFKLTGYIKNVKDGQIELSDSYGTDPNFKPDKKTVNITNGLFEFTGEIAYPFKVYLNYTGKDEQIGSEEFFIDFGDQSLTAVDDSSNIADVKLKGSAINTAYLKNYLPLFISVNNEKNKWYSYFEKCYDKLKADSTGKAMDSLEYALDRINNKKDSIFYVYVKTHPNSYLSLWELDNRLNTKYGDYLAKAYNLLDKHMQETYLGNRAFKAITGLKKTQIGSKLVDLNLLDTSKRPISLAFKHTQNTGYLFVDLWYSNCGGCIAQFTQLKDIYEQYKFSGFNIAGISVIERNTEDWIKAIKKNQLQWPQYYDKNGYIIYQLYIHFFPSNFLLDEQGNIIAKNLEPFQLKHFLNQHILPGANK